MSYLDNLVSQALDKQKAQYISDLEKSKADAQSQIDSAQSALNKQADELLGYKKGLIAPAYQGTQAGVLERGSMLETSGGYAVQVVGTSPSLIEEIIIGAIVTYAFYRFFLKGKI